MNTWVIANQFGIENLTLEAREEATLGPHDVRLVIRALSLNYRDYLVITGGYNPRQPLPLVPLSDGVGEVVAVGSAVTRVAIGDRVAGAFATDWVEGDPNVEKLRSTLGSPRDGMAARSVVLPEHGVVHVPSYLTDTEAATLPCAALTAWNALFESGQVKSGEVVLVQGTGGVSLFALQMAHAIGARVIVTSSSDAKLERARALGAWQTINYRSDEHWGKTARKMVDGRGVDHVIEVGGVGTLNQSLNAVRQGGAISVIGVLAGGVGKVNLVKTLMNAIRLQGILVGSRVMFERMNRALEVHQMRPQVDREFDFDALPEALRYLESAQHMGKVVLRT